MDHFQRFFEGITITALPVERYFCGTDIIVELLCFSEKSFFTRDEVVRKKLAETIDRACTMSSRVFDRDGITISSL